MGLGISTSGGDFDPYLKYNAKAGRWFTKPDGGGEEIEVTNVVGIFDFANIKTGWFHFSEGSGPDIVLHRTLFDKVAKPSPNHKEGFTMRVLLSADSGGGVKEFSSTAGAVIGEIDGLHTFVEAAPEYKAGKMPVVQFTGITAMKTKHGTNYTPGFKVIAWRPRPDELKAVDDTPAASASPPASVNGNGYGSDYGSSHGPAPSGGNYVLNDQPF